MKPLSWLVLYVLLSSTGHAQSRIDSLKSRLPVVLDSADAEDAASYLSMIGNEFLASSQYDSALSYYFRSLSVGTGVQVRAATLNSIGIVYNNKGNPDSCLAYYARALESYYAARDTVRAAILEINMSIVYRNMGMYELSLAQAFSALRKLEDREKDRTLASLYNTIGSVYLRIGDRLSALEHYKHALKIRIMIGYTRGVGQSYTNIGELFIGTKQYDSALANLLRAVEIKRADRNQSELGSTLSLIGQAYLEMNRFAEAEGYLVEARDLKRRVGERATEGAILNNIGRLRIQQARYGEAERNLDQAEVLIRETETLDELRRNLELRVKLLKAMGRLSKALPYMEELLVVKDSLLNKEKSESLQAIQLQYNVERREQQIKLLEREQDARTAELETKQVWIGALAVTLVLGTIATILILLQYRAVSRSKKRAELLLKEVNHRVKNNLQILTSLFHLPYVNITDKVAQEAVKDGEGRVNAMSLIHNMLSLESSSRLIPMQPYLVDLAEYLSNSYGYRKNNGGLSVRCDGIQLDIDKAVPVGLIVNELVSNSMKYAFSDQPTPAILVQLLSKPGVVELVVSDNGVGFKRPAELNNAGSFGLRLIDLLSRELKGKTVLSAETGTHFCLTIPIN